MCKYKYAVLYKQDTPQIKLSYIYRLYTGIVTKSKYPGAEKPVSRKKIWSLPYWNNRMKSTERKNNGVQLVWFSNIKCLCCNNFK
jgi:hypothetical protein